MKLAVCGIMALLLGCAVSPASPRAERGVGAGKNDLERMLAGGTTLVIRVREPRGLRAVP